MSKTIVVANWKMNPSSFREAKKLLDATKKAAEKNKAVSVVVAPPAIYLRELAERSRGRALSFAVQHAHFEAKGSYTGEISLAEAEDSRARYAIIGHAERRALGESDDDVRKKVATALSLKLTPIMCVGERERNDHGGQYEIVKAQLRAALADVPPGKLSSVLVVYEPLWTIGASATMHPRDMHQMGIFMRKCVVDTHGEPGRSLKILYGGSVDSANIRAMQEGGDVRGFLVGRASANPQEFTRLLAALN